MFEKEKYKIDAALWQEYDKRIGAASIIAQNKPHAPASMMRADTDRVDKNMDYPENLPAVSVIK